MEQIYHFVIQSSSFCSNMKVIGKSEEGISSPDIVVFNRDKLNVVGFYKKLDNMYSNVGCEYIISLLGNILGVSTAEAALVYEDDAHTRLKGIISISVVQNTDEYFISFQKMRDELFWDLKSGKIPMTQWIKEWSDIRARKGRPSDNQWEVPAMNSFEYISCLKFPFEIARLWTEKHNITLQDFEEDILKMVLFDILLGQADRTPSNYGLRINRNTNSATLSPLFDNGTLIKPYLDENQNGFNQMLLERKLVFEAAINLWGDFARRISTEIIEKSHLIIKTVENNKSIISETEYNILIRRIKWFSGMCKNGGT